MRGFISGALGKNMGLTVNSATPRGRRAGVQHRLTSHLPCQTRKRRGNPSALFFVCAHLTLARGLTR